MPLANGELLVCGSFANIGGVSQMSLARLNQDGDLDRSFHPDIDGPVGRMAVQPDGEIVIVGNFTHVNGKARNNLARLNAKGQLDATFDCGTGPDWPPASVALEPDGKILVGGFFASFAGTERRGAARLLPNGQLDPSYDLKIDDYAPYFFPAVTKFIVRPDGSHFLIGFQLFQVAGVYMVGNPALVNNNGTLNSSYGGYTNSLFENIPPTAAELQSDGRMLISGAFQYYNPSNPDPGFNGDYSFSLWRLKVDGSIDFSFDPLNFPVDLGGFGNVKGEIADVSVQADGKILIAGDFSQVSGVPRKGMARIIVP